MAIKIRKRRPILFLVILCNLCLYVGGCGVKQAKLDSERFLSRHFAMLATNGVYDALSDYGSEFYRNTPRQQWAQVLMDVPKQLGGYQKHSITRWQVYKQTGLNSGTTVVLDCNVVYERDTAHEQFTLFKPYDATNFLIKAHAIVPSKR